MSDKLHNAYKIDTQARESLLRPNAKLDYAISNSAANNLPTISITDLQGQYLAIQCRLLGAKSVLEIGTLGGYSTIWFASAGASVTSIEIDPKHRDVALENTKGLDVDIILGAALDVLPKLAKEGKKFDFVFIDADWGEQWEYFEWATKLTRVGGAIYIDNVVREILEEEEDKTVEDWLVTKVGKEKKVDASLISTVSSYKGNSEEMFDGFILAIVKE